MLPKFRTIFSRPPPNQSVEQIMGRKHGQVDKSKSWKRKHLHAKQHKQSINESSDAKKQEEKFNNLVEKCDDVLMRLTAVFPFDLFPDELTIEHNQVNVVIKNFFLSSHVQSIPIKNVADVFVETSPFFATLKIIDRSYIENSVAIHYLKKNEAIKARQIIQGLIVATSQDVDVSQVPDETIRKNVSLVGRAAGVPGERI